MATSGPNYPGTSDNLEDGTGGSPAGGAWASPDNVRLDDGSNASWSKPAASNVVGDALEVSAFGTFTGVGSGDTIDTVTVEVETSQANTTRLDPFQVELWDGASAQIGTTRTTTDTTALTIDSFDFTGVAFAQLATLRVRVRPRGAAANAQSSTATADFVRLTVTYTPAVSGDVTAEPAVLAATVTASQPAAMVGAAPLVVVAVAVVPQATADGGGAAAVATLTSTIRMGL